MSVEEKMKKRQEIQQQITELNQQLRQHQIEQRKEQQAKKSSMEDMLGGSKQKASKVEKQNAGLSQASMRAMISSDSALEQARVQGGVAAKMDGRAGVLEVEIKLDMARGNDVEAKKEELAEVQEKAINAETAQMNTLAEANKEIEEAAKAEQQAESADGKDKNNVATEENQKAIENVKSETDTESNGINLTEVVGISVSETTAYGHVDVRL